MKLSAKIATSVAASAVAVARVSAGTLDDVKARGELKCGVSGGVPGFSAPDDAGRMQGIDAAVCDAVAAATVLGDAGKGRIHTTNGERAFCFASGEVDVLSRNTTHTLTREHPRMNFTYYNYIDGQGFMVMKDSGIKSTLELDGASICVQAGTTTELNMADYFRNNNMKFTPVGYETSTQTREGFEGGACDVLTSDKSQLAALSTEMKVGPAGVTILPETISKEPLGPVVRQGDDQWMDIVAMTLYALINAEELGITSGNIDGLKAKPVISAVARLVGAEGNMGELLGLGADWSYNAIKQVGNYGEIYERTVAPIGIPRAGSVNDLWTRGGILYAPPIR